MIPSEKARLLILNAINTTPYDGKGKIRPAIRALQEYIAKIEDAAWEGVVSMRIPFRQCHKCRGVDPRCTEMIADSRVTNVGHQPGCPYLGA